MVYTFVLPRHLASTHKDPTSVNVNLDIDQLADILVQVKQSLKPVKLCVCVSLFCMCVNIILPK